MNGDSESSADAGCVFLTYGGMPASTQLNDFYRLRARADGKSERELSNSGWLDDGGLSGIGSCRCGMCFHIVLS
jgi:hypothetical protein